jgi:hypothetical protein
MAVHSENYTNTINTLCEKNAELLNFIIGGTYMIPLCFK